MSGRPSQAQCPGLGTSCFQSPALMAGLLGWGFVSEPEEWLGAGWDGVQVAFSPLPLFLAQGELYFMSTAVPSATAARGVVYKVIDPSR